MVGTIKKHEKKINVWGCFSANGVGNLYRINGNLTGEAYKQILINQMMPSAQKLFTTNNWTFQHDNDPKHTSRIVKQYLQDSKIKVLY